MLQRFTTKASTRLERSRQWCALTQAQNVEFADDHEASIRGGDFGELRLCVVSMGRYRMAQPGTDGRKDASPCLKFLFQEEGEARLVQGNCENAIHSGQWSAIRKDIPYEIHAPAHSRQLCITIPCDLISGPRQGVKWWRQPRSFLRGPAQILHASASATLLSGGSLSHADRREMGLQLAQMAAMVIRNDDPRAPPSIKEVRRLAILDYIDRHLDDPDLGVARLAKAFDCSSRTIHKLFEDEASSVARTIWDRRLERCRDEIVDPSMAARSITTIAHDWGFSDSQHFSRAFKARYGMTPRDYRALHLPN